MKRNKIWLFTVGLLAVSVTCATSPPPVQWLKTFPKGKFGGWVAQTDDRGYVVAGTWRPDNESSDFYLVKTDSLGNLKWEKTLGVGPRIWVYSGCLSKDGGYVLAGTKLGRSGSYLGELLVKTDSLGNMIWSKGFEDDTTNDFFFHVTSVQPTMDGGHIIGGYGERLGEEPLAAHLIKIDSAGNEKWRRAINLGYRFGYIITRLSVQQTLDRGYIIGTIQDYGVSSDKN